MLTRVAKELLSSLSSSSLSFRRTALHCAAYGGFTECMTVLLDAGAEVGRQDGEGITALHWASSAGHGDAVELLLGTGANPNLMEVDGEHLTPLDYAIIGGHQEVAQVLIECGALSISGIQELAATAIQRSVRGYLARKRVAALRSKQKEVGSIAVEQKSYEPSAVDSERVVSAESKPQEDRTKERRR